MRGVILAGLLALHSTAWATGGAGGISTALSPGSVPTGAHLETTWRWGARDQAIIPVAIDVHPAGGIWGIEQRRHHLFQVSARGDSLQFATRQGADLSLGFADRLFARSGLKVFSLDRFNAVVERFDLNGYWEERLDLAAAAATQGEEVGEVADFCIDRNGDLYVLDARRARILQFDDAGGFRRVLGDGERLALRSPVALEIDGHGRLFLLESEPPGLIIFDPEGEQSRVWRAVGGSDSVQVCALAVDQWGNAFVGDLRSACVRVLRADGAPAWRIGGAPEDLRPTDLATDNAGRLFVADARQAAVWVFALTYQTNGSARDARDSAR